MRCPFLREAQVKSCCASPYKKMIARTATQPSNERCSSSEWLTCPAAKQHCQEQTGIDRCPFLQESLIQYCSAVPTSQYIPYSEASLSRCGGERHSYCEVFLSASRPEFQNPTTERDHYSEAYAESMLYSPNHMWMNTHGDGTCHIGIDAFLAGLLREVEKLSYVTVKGTCFPTAVLTVRGVDLQLTFPNRIRITEVNSHLRARLANITSHPYTLGWLFEGAEPGIRPDVDRLSNDCGWVKGNQAKKWLAQESRCLTEFVHNELLPARSGGSVTMMDGGVFSEDLITHLTREEMLRLFNEFFSPTVQLRFGPGTTRS